MSDGTSGYPWYWRAKNAMPAGWKRSARKLADGAIAGVAGSVNGGPAGGRAACLTLDDGPDPETTPAILKELAARDLRCTYFLLVDQVRLHPGLAREIAAAGHEIALHGLDHRPVSGMSTSTARSYLSGARSELEDVVQQAVRWYRPPYGSQSVASYLGARRAGLDVVVWSSDAQDWVDRDGAAVAADALAGAAPGAIMLFHERLEPHPTRGAPSTSFDRAQVVARIADGMQDRGLTPTTVGNLATHHRTAWFRP